MGSVIDNIECPNCKNEAFMDFYYKTGEEYVSCNNCGYRYSQVIINRDKNLSELTKDDWQIEEIKPYAATRLKHYGDLGTYCGVVEGKVQYDEFVDFCKSIDTIEYASTSRLVDGEIVSEIIIDNGPEIDSAGYTIEDRKNENDLNAFENSTNE
jgi:Zn ribbon nucleic-acid-binding protein